jgi:hypothetical protein
MESAKGIKETMEVDGVMMRSRREQDRRWKMRGKKRSEKQKKSAGLAFLQPDRVGISTSFIASLPPRLPGGFLPTTALLDPVELLV